jgi:pyruvate/2-oxoglutarate/acetoin dehydrogenase E1 component
MSTPTDDAAAAVAGPATLMTYRDAVNAALDDALAADGAVLLMGEDVGADGGVFKTNSGLIEKYGPERVRNTPICENGFLGVALGMSLVGMRPIVEIMFADFLPSGGDALVNQLPKYRFMSGGQTAVPVTVRAIGGATGRFGTQHSATGESWFMHLPGLRVVTAGSPGAAYGLLRAAIDDPNPVIFYEHKGLYARKGPVTRGGIGAEVIDLRWLRPLDLPAVRASVEKTGRVVIVEEQVHAAGWGATIISELTIGGIAWASAPRRLSLPDDLPMPYTPPLEDEVLPSVGGIVAAARASVGR